MLQTGFQPNFLLPIGPCVWILRSRVAALRTAVKIRIGWLFYHSLCCGDAYTTVACFGFWVCVFSLQRFDIQQHPHAQPRRYTYRPNSLNVDRLLCILPRDHDILV
jgi:hypothetical protein